MNRRGWKLAVPLVLLTLLTATCLTALIAVNVQAQAGSGGPDSIKLLSFYEKGCCQACSDSDGYVREALDRYYGEEVKSGKISFQTVNLKTDRAMADKYNAKMQCLKMLVTRNGQETVVDVPEVWLYIGDKEAFISSLKAAVDRQLGR